MKNSLKYPQTRCLWRNDIVINIKKKSNCSGCAACASICPHGCIEMKPDEEGFLYPVVAKDSCTQCNLCEKICPILHPTDEIPCTQDAYIVQIRDEQLRAESTSGGAFTAIASHVIGQGGVVFGAAFDDNLIVKHRYVQTHGQLGLFRNSKYVQSEIGNTYKEAKAFLDEGKLTCFSGTSCETEGLLSYLQHDYPNLILVDVICRAVPSPLVLKKYIEQQQGRYKKDINSISFRDKSLYGYKYSQLTLRGPDGTLVYHNGIDSDPYLRAFFSNICDRPSCHECRFKKIYRLSDFTIWDCFEPGRFCRDMDDGKGTTRMLIHTDKGRSFFEQIRSDIRYFQLTPEKAIANFKEIRTPIPIHPSRSDFLRDVNTLDSQELFRRYFPDTFKVKAERIARRAAHKLGFYRYMRQFYRFLKIKSSKVGMVDKWIQK